MATTHQLKFHNDVPQSFQHQDLQSELQHKEDRGERTTRFQSERTDTHTNQRMDVPGLFLVRRDKT
jgi:hypothetical protein